MHTPTYFTLGLTLTLLGCSTPPPAPAAPAPASLAKSKSPVPVWVHHGRYTLVSTRPTLEQRQPLYQLINVRIAPALHATVGEALRHVLQHSGYSPCPESPAMAQLFRRPLPAVHHDLGPISLLDALTVIGGPAWRLDIDPAERSVCYTLRLPPPESPFSTLETAP